MPAPYNGDPTQYPAAIDCPVDADPPNAWATTHPLQQLADRTASISQDLPKTGLANVWRELQKFLKGIVVSNTEMGKPGVQASGGPRGGAGVVGSGTQGGRGVVGVGDGTGAGVQGSSDEGPGGVFLGNAGRAALNLTPQASPASAQDGDLFIEASSGFAKLRTVARWAALVLTGQPTVETLVLNGGPSDDSPARQVTALPVKRKLVEEIANKAGLKTRFYSTPDGLELTTNCAWDAGNQRWVPDTAPTMAVTRAALTAQGIRFQSMAAPTSPFWEVDWSDATKTRSFMLGADADTIWQGEHTVGIPGEPQFRNGWVMGLRPMYFAKDALGQVHLTGQVMNGRLGMLNPIFTLPPGYCPAHNLYRVVATGATPAMLAGIVPGTVVINSTGDVWLLSGDPGSVLLDLSFLSGF